MIQQVEIMDETTSSKGPERMRLRLAGEKCPTVWEAVSWKQKKTRWVKNTENFQVENKKVEEICIREFTFCAKREALHSSREVWGNTEAWEKLDISRLGNMTYGQFTMNKKCLQEWMPSCDCGTRGRASWPSPGSFSGNALVSITLQRPLRGSAALVCNQLLLHLDLGSLVFFQGSPAVHFFFGERCSAWPISNVSRSLWPRKLWFNLELAAMLEQHFQCGERGCLQDMLTCPLLRGKETEGKPTRCGLEHCPRVLLTQSPSVGRENQDVKMECLRLKTIFHLNRADLYSMSTVTDCSTSQVLEKPAENVLT